MLSEHSFRLGDASTVVSKRRHRKVRVEKTTFACCEEACKFSLQISRLRALG